MNKYHELDRKELGDLHHLDFTVEIFLTAYGLLLIFKRVMFSTGSHFL